ncbi:hypothetical protein DICVIV_08689 [Dictyocaulus viviparus]|uniref:Uncharacterized protein n=1 Tax=Dictyocaulus viviparus TaxID=29172 RepID=A0A0D8XKX5_DICVI|nr:hypothetical protein DICVIV_08689 [Dictyocaulus viviparus]
MVPSHIEDITYPKVQMIVILSNGSCLGDVDDCGGGGERVTHLVLTSEAMLFSEGQRFALEFYETSSQVSGKRKSYSHCVGLREIDRYSIEQTRNRICKER